MRTYVGTSATIFGLLAFVEVVRLAVRSSLRIGEVAVPCWLSVISMLSLVALSSWGLLLIRGSPTEERETPASESDTHPDRAAAQAAAQYDAIVAVRNAELQSYWTRYNIQVILNGGLIVAVLAVDRAVLKGRINLWFLASGGFALSLSWVIMILRGKVALHRWDGFLARLEGLLDLVRVFTEVTRRKPGLWAGISEAWRNMTLGALAVPMLCIMFWLIFPWCR